MTTTAEFVVQLQPLIQALGTLLALVSVWALAQSLAG